MRGMVFIVGLVATAGLAEAEWYEGGSLHRATAQEWLDASFDNKIATSADFVLIALGGEKVAAMGGRANSDGLAADMMICIDQSLKGLNQRSLKALTVPQLSEACATLLKPDWIQQESFD